MNVISADQINQLNADFPRLFRKGNYCLLGLYGNWFNLIYQTCQEIEQESSRLKLDDANWPEIIDCSEKYGTLRFCTDSDIKSIYTITDGVEAKSEGL
jgi:hypothetical protein